MKISLNKLALSVVVNLIAVSAFAAKVQNIQFVSNANVPPQNIPVPSPQEAGFMSDNEIMKLAGNFKLESKRRPAGGATVGTEDMLSKEFIAFRDKIIKAKTGAEFNDIIKEYDAKYDQIPKSANDLKYVVARMAGWLPMHGVVWRMAPLVHKVVVTQEMLLATLRNMAEQVKINMDDTHAETQLQFLTIPSAQLVGKQFKVESDFIGFLATEVYPGLAKAIKRLSTLEMANIQEGGKQTPLVFDAKIRFGEDAFIGTDYEQYDRYKMIGEPERFATLARLNRRMFNISTMAAYNWNGYMSLRRDIGKLFGMAVSESALFEMVPGNGEAAIFIRGATRESRIKAIKQYKDLYKLTPNGKQWMKQAYMHLHQSAVYLDRAWAHLKNEDSGYVMQIDPEVFMGRKEQIQAGIDNFMRIAGPYGDGVSGKVTVRGNLSGESVTVDLKGYYDNPPTDMKNLLPIAFAKNEDVMVLNKLNSYKNLKEIAGNDGDLLQVQFGDKPLTFRNYMFGRSKSWSTSPDAYGRLFPGLKDGTQVADSMRILNETRGARVITNSLTLFTR